jgi:predicted nucleic acid-binding protein
MMAPDLLNAEVISALSRLERRGELTPERSAQAVEDLQIAPVHHWHTTALLLWVWGLRANVSAYDACYVALARSLGCPLVTIDARLARVAGLRVSLILV